MKTYPTFIFEAFYFIVHYLLFFNTTIPSEWIDVFKNIK